MTPSPEKTTRNKTVPGEVTRASLELLYHISRELTTALDLKTVLRRVLFLSMRNVGAITGSILVVDDSGMPVESAMITGDVVHSHATQRLRDTLDRGLAGWVARNRKGALVEDTSKDPRWVQRFYDSQDVHDSKSAVSAPLLVHDRLVGVLTLVHPQVGFFTQEHFDLIQAIADQASIAVLNARLYAESKYQAQLMTALAESAAAIASSIQLDEVLQRILEQISYVLQVEAVSLALINPEDRQIIFRAAIGWQKPFSGARLQFGQSVAGWVAVDGHGVVIRDVKEDPRYDAEVDQRTGLATRAIACAPIRDIDQIIGVLEAINPLEKSFEPDALLVLTGIGGLAGTAIRHAQLFERLQAANQSYQELFDDSIDPILITDIHGSIIEANRRALEIANYGRDTLRGMSIFQLHTIDDAQVGPHLENLVCDQTISYESILRTRSKHDVPIQVHVRRIILEGMQLLQWIFRDITERKNLDTLREDLIAMIYHDLRAPLANVVSSLDVIETMLANTEYTDLLSLLNIAMRSTERIQRLTNSLLDIKRLEAGQPLGDRFPGNPLDIIKDALETVSPVAKNKQQALGSTCPERLPLVIMDEEMIRRVLINLIENAIKYTPAGGSIQVGAESDSSWLKIWIQDTGPGIPASEHERIFDKFTRLNNTENTKGLGLGLAYCRLAVQGHGGRIWVESEPAKGARFTFTLPVIDNLAQLPEA
ncbi:MAG: GAF domain-containing protein [Chloroflexota bacterium]